MNELKPCPWCGEIPYIQKGYCPPMLAIECRNFDECIILPRFSVDVPCKKNEGKPETFSPLFDVVLPEAIKAWNTRVDGFDL